MTSDEPLKCLKKTWRHSFQRFNGRVLSVTLLDGPVQSCKLLGGREGGVVLLLVVSGDSFVWSFL